MPKCTSPVPVDNMGGLANCGQCHPCRVSLRRKKTARLLLESKDHDHILFVCLTYSDKYLPRHVIHEFENKPSVHYHHHGGVLDKDELGRFLKRLRQRVFRGTGKRLRAFYAGEYGGQTMRPHYHLILYGLPYASRHYIFDAWTNPTTGELQCDPSRLDVQIPKSIWHVSQYCAQYLLKKMTKPDARGLDGRSPEFARGSLGVGLSYVPRIAELLRTKSGAAYVFTYRDIPRVFKLEGKTFPLDRYMREKILAALEITQEAKAVGFQKYSQEMSAMLSRSSDNAKIPKRWILESLGNSARARRVRGWRLEKQYAVENAQQFAIDERKEAFFNKRGKK